MARLQVVELPTEQTVEGNYVSPYLLVFDNVTAQDLVDLPNADVLTATTGARSVLMVPGTLEVVND